MPQFAKLYHAVLARTDMKLLDKVLATFLLDRQQLYPAQSPGYRWLARVLGVSENQVRRSMLRLVHLGIAEVTRRGRCRTGAIEINESALRAAQLLLFPAENAETAPPVRGHSATGGPQTAPPVRYQLRRPCAVTAPPVRGPLTTQTDTDTTDSASAGALACADGKPSPASRPKGTAKAAKPKTTPKPREPDPVWDHVCRVWSLEPVTPAQRSRVGRIVRDLKALGASPADLDARMARYRVEWPRAECTPEALLKHWERFAMENSNGRNAGTGRTSLASNERYLAANQDGNGRAEAVRALPPDAAGGLSEPDAMPPMPTTHRPKGTVEFG